MCSVTLQKIIWNVYAMIIYQNHVVMQVCRFSKPSLDIIYIYYMVIQRIITIITKFGQVILQIDPTPYFGSMSIP